MLQASAQWNWYACSQSNTLRLDMGPEMAFCTPYKLRQLTDLAFDNPHFNLRDAEFYQQVTSYLANLGCWSPSQICQIALNATAAKFYLKPVLAKSWFFTPYLGSLPSTEAIVNLQSVSDSGQFLIVDHSEHASLCLCLENLFSLDENLSLKQFEVIRVLNDRIHPINIDYSQQKRA